MIEMMNHDGKPLRFSQQLLAPLLGQSAPLPGLLEERILELESLGLVDDVEITDEPSSIRQYAMASLLNSKPPYFVTLDPQLIEFRDLLETRYGLMIFSVPEAIMLLRETDEPPN